MNLIKSTTLSFLFFSIHLLAAQENISVDWLKNSASNDIYTTHSFYTSTYHDGNFYLAGDFWKDLSIDEHHIEIEDDIADGFIFKIDENGNASQLWHFESAHYARINNIAVNPVTSSLIIVGSFSTNLVFNNYDWNTPYFGDGFVMSIDLDGTFNWIKEIDSATETSSAGAATLAFDQAGNIYFTAGVFGSASIEEQAFSFDEETIGLLLVKLDPDGNLLQTQKWQPIGFESFIDITDMAIDVEDNLIIGGTIPYPVMIDEFEVSPPAAGSQPFVMKFNNDFSPIWINTYISFNGLVNDVFIDGTDILLSTQYNTSINIDGITLTGTGSWGELAFMKLDKSGALQWVKNITLTENGGNSGVYARDICKWLDHYFIAGMYQGDAMLDDEVILDNTASGSSFQYPYILSFTEEGVLTNTYGFQGSDEPSRIATISNNDTHLVFAGNFSGQVNLEGNTVNTINSALFYGALKSEDAVTSTQATILSTQTLNIYPTIASDKIFIDKDPSIKEFTIFDQLGNKISNTVQTEKPNHTQAIDVQHLASGLYFIHAFDGVNVLNGKFIKN